MSKKIAGFLLLLLGAAVCYPIFFLFTGSLMGTGELQNHLGAALSLGEQPMSWSLLPLTPTLRHYVQLLLDSPEFFICSGILPHSLPESWPDSYWPEFRLPGDLPDMHSLSKSCCLLYTYCS